MRWVWPARMMPSSPRPRTPPPIPSGDSDVDVTAPRPNVGSVIPVAAASAHLTTAGTLMEDGGVGFDERRVQSAADILTMGQLIQYTMIDLEPSHKISTRQTWGLILLVAFLVSAGVLTIRRRSFRAAGAVGIVLLLAIIGQGVNVEAHMDASLSRAVQDADLVVVGHVTGLVDPSTPESQSTVRPHVLTIERVLKGVDQAGHTVSALARGARWDAGQSYVLFLKQDGLGQYRAVSTLLKEASTDWVSTVNRELEAQGGSVSPARTVWVQHVSSWGQGVMAEFFVDVDGDYEWTQRTAVSRGQPVAVASRHGVLSPEDVSSVILAIESADDGPIADDAGVATFRWIDDAGQVRTRTFLMPTASPCVDIMQLIETLSKREAN